VGIIGGSAYDYLAYVSYVREKKWGRDDLKIILFDSITSFVAVLVFTIVFASLGALVLQPKQEIPAGTDLLSLQAQFVTPLFPALKYVYFVGAFLAVFGTLYGTVEVAPAIAREILPNVRTGKLRMIAVLWVCGVAGVFLAGSISFRVLPGLITFLTPANLFTGVLASGFVCLLVIWADLKWLPAADRMPMPFMILNGIGGVMFLALGVKGYYDFGSVVALWIFVGTIFAGLIAAVVINRGRKG
jgi:hypothetical protein